MTPETAGADAARAVADRAVAAELETVVAEARRLLSDHRAQAAGCGDADPCGAADPPYRKPGLLERLRERVRGWIATHADVLTRIARGPAQRVPGARHREPGAGLPVPGADRDRRRHGRGRVDAARGGVHRARAPGPGWPLDATLTVVPTGPAARMVRLVPGVARGLKAVNRAVPAAARGRIFRAVRNLPEGISADQLAAAAARIRSGAGGITGDVVVQGSRAGHSARAGSDIDFGLRVPADRYDRLIEDFFGDRVHRGP